jgi:hypothetical protein
MALTVSGDSFMTDMLVSKNIGALVTVKNGSTNNTLTAAGTGDNTAKTGVGLDRQGLGAGMPMSMVASVLFDATLASGSTLTTIITVSDSADNSTFAAYASEAAAVVIATGPSGGGVVSGCHSLAVDLSSARRYVRVDHVPDLTRAGTDTAITRAVAVLAGFDRLAAPASV